MKSAEELLHEANEKIKTLTLENTQLKEAVSTGKIATAKAERDGQLKESKLPAPCVARLSEAFKASTDNAGLKEAINVESEYVKSLGVIVKHNGAGANGTDNTNGGQPYVVNEASRIALGRKMGLSEAEAKAFAADKKEQKEF